jgi:outer membrane murein-binding lipoprotein Lpp
MKTISKLTIMVAVCGISLFFACNKKDKDSDTNTLSTDKDNVQTVTASDQISTDMEQAFDDGYNVASNEMATTDGLVLGPCVTVTLTQNGNMKTLTIDYGSTGCVCSDGKTRKGKLIATATNFNQVNVIRTLSTDNYYVNDYHVDGNITRNITHVAADSSRTVELVENLTVTNPGGNDVYTRSGNQTRILFVGVPNHPMDNTLTTWGQVNVQRPSGLQISRTVDQTTPLLYKNSCHQIVNGIAHIVRNNHDITVDFGDGTCDGIATVSNGNNTWTINL